MSSKDLLNMASLLIGLGVALWGLSRLLDSLTKYHAVVNLHKTPPHDKH